MKLLARTGLKVLAAGAVLFAASLTANVASASSIRTVLNDRELFFDVPPVIEQERTLLPLRGILEPLGAQVDYNADTRTITATLGDKVVTTVLDQKAATVNGQQVELEVPARAIDGRTMIPVRFFAEAFGIVVDWDGATRTVLLYAPRELQVAQADRSAADRNAAKLVESASALVGTQYSWGGISPSSGFDCSGFVYYLLGELGIKAPRTSQEQYGLGVSVSRKDLKAGDLVFFETYASGPTHVGIYDGQGSFIHAQSADTGVRVTAMSNPWWSTRYLGARRVVR